VIGSVTINGVVTGAIEMDVVTVKKDELLKVLEENRAKHRALFEEAQVSYRKRVIKELDRRLEDAKAGRKFNTYISLPVPEDHTEDYDTEIRMLELEVAEEVKISGRQFTQLVMDDWGWKASFTANTVAYTASAGG
jgi:hypothetical protein